MTHPRYQVFVSSTYTDLIEERQQVTTQLLRQRCIPAGMELFTASGLPPWDVIKSAIDTTDYMILILAGRYGSSVGSDGLSYTEREYDYAESLGIPILAFLHDAPNTLPANQVDTGRLAKKRDAFWRKVRDTERHTTDFWSNAADLAQKVATAVPEAIRTQPRPGWIRGSGETDQEADRSGAPVSPPPNMTTSDALREALAEPGGVSFVERIIAKAAREVVEIPFVLRQAEFNTVADVPAEHAQRRARLEEAARSLVLSVASAARWGRPELDRHWLALISELGANPRLSGYTHLVDLVRAPALLVFTAAGLGACAGGRDELIGLLLSDQVEVDNPYRDEDLPGVCTLTSELLYPGESSSQRLRAYMQAVLAEDAAWQGSTFDRAWERWEFLVAVARTYYREHLRAPSGSLPFLRIEDAPGGVRAHRTVAGKSIRKEVARVGDGHPLLANGLCGGSAELFETAADTFDASYGEWGDNQDWRALPGGGGVLPSGPHHPGVRTE